MQATNVVVCIKVFAKKRNHGFTNLPVGIFEDLKVDITMPSDVLFVQRDNLDPLEIKRNGRTSPFDQRIGRAT